MSTRPYFCSRTGQARASPGYRASVLPGTCRHHDTTTHHHRLHPRTGLLRRGCGIVCRLCSSRRMSSTSATRLLPPLVGAQYTRLLRASPHSRAAACQGYMLRTPLASKACTDGQRPAHRAQGADRAAAGVEITGKQALSRENAECAAPTCCQRLASSKGRQAGQGETAAGACSSSTHLHHAWRQAPV